MDDEDNGRRRYRGKGVKGRKNEAGRPDWNGLRLVACGILLGTAFLVRLCFPAAIDAARETLLPAMERDFDYKAAIASVGETLTGENGMMEVLGDIYIKAFGGGETEVPVSETDGQEGLAGQ